LEKRSCWQPALPGIGAARFQAAARRLRKRRSLKLATTERRPPHAEPLLERDALSSVELDWMFGYPFAIVMMIVSAIVLYWYFKRRRWF
jgi:hypothetical protein